MKGWVPLPELHKPNLVVAVVAERRAEPVPVVVLLQNVVRLDVRVFYLGRPQEDIDGRAAGVVAVDVVADLA